MILPANDYTMPVLMTRRAADSHMANTAEHLDVYAKRGWGAVPLEFRTKIPAAVGGWESPRNVALVLGAASGHLADVDLDSPEAVRLAPKFLPPTVGFGHGGETRHLLYVADGAMTRRFSAPDRVTMVELRANSSTGGPVYTMAPPSVHPDGEALVWSGDGEAVHIDAAELLQRVEALAAACVAARGG